MIKIEQYPFSEDLRTHLLDGLKEHAIEKTGFDGLGESICFIAKDGDEMIGAVIIQPFWGALHIKILWVVKKSRGNGVGTRLMETAFKYALDHSLKFAYVETMNFQAVEFYEKLGFFVEFKRDGYSNDSSFCYLQKRF